MEILSKIFSKKVDFAWLFRIVDNIYLFRQHRLYYPDTLLFGERVLSCFTVIATVEVENSAYSIILINENEKLSRSKSNSSANDNNGNRKEREIQAHKITLMVWSKTF